MSEGNPVPELIDESPAKSDFTRVCKDLLAGTAGGIAQVLVGQPFDTTKVRLQTSRTPTTASTVVKDLVKNEGFRGFYKGTLTPLIGVGACVSVQFGMNEAMKRLFRSRNPQQGDVLTLPQYYACGFVGGTSNAFLASPIEHVRIRLQTQTKRGGAAEFRGPVDCIRKLVAQKVLMRGLSAAMLREAHGCGIYFLTYEALIAQQLKRRKLRTEIPAWKLCLYGGLSGMTLWLSVYPLDVVKSVMQTDNLTKPTLGSSPIQVATTIYGKYGYSAFFKGFGPTMLRAAPANAVTFLAFEAVMRLVE
ncbi:LAMI_0E09824g1_1 [Lachancea mirantina]|uniref:LAMI_0E09824g1_1 n=1 Tax=Lachancea mirantina TaxID=1230905 RepID=A0A1G4JP75_9SACH|nr:LAMI_0E09824g1_1 [Lachancea mirantina]